MHTTLTKRQSLLQQILQGNVIHQCSIPLRLHDQHYQVEYHPGAHPRHKRQTDRPSSMARLHRRKRHRALHRKRAPLIRVDAKHRLQARHIHDRNGLHAEIPLPRRNLPPTRRRRHTTDLENRRRDRRLHRLPQAKFRYVSPTHCRYQSSSVH